MCGEMVIGVRKVSLGRVRLQKRAPRGNLKPRLGADFFDGAQFLGKSPQPRGLGAKSLLDLLRLSRRQLAVASLRGAQPPGGNARLPCKSASRDSQLNPYPFLFGSGHNCQPP